MAWRRSDVAYQCHPTWRRQRNGGDVTWREIDDVEATNMYALPYHRNGMLMYLSQQHVAKLSMTSS